VIDRVEIQGEEPVEKNVPLTARSLHHALPLLLQHHRQRNNVISLEREKDKDKDKRAKVPPSLFLFAFSFPLSLPSSSFSYFPLILIFEFYQKRSRSGQRSEMLGGCLDHPYIPASDRVASVPGGECS